eukprot:CAMPEP_0184341190 /NCGR_PEP_ID=MMETSP1089-20130417/9814_1 /TAXON_ID=38269 ORGANISM="Gloeochaete wittrockiana, Strain SAG46.84" /NCGR_SAMPLE_ID=MMETSP1089 /ASSEMBLY_ACC=CAM_ASM_000445 /LENGTH=524 /DNA_ID=CAMNT_0026669353 /DNA_START=466 /DNA_END=2043 /DNA_ORIENTATION=-
MESLGSFDTHLSQALRLAILFKFGGMYVDENCIMARPLLSDSFRNGLILFDEENYDAADLSFIYFDRYSPVVLRAMYLFLTEYNPDYFQGNFGSVMQGACLEHGSCVLIPSETVFTISQILPASGYGSWSLKTMYRVLAQSQQSATFIRIPPIYEDENGATPSSIPVPPIGSQCHRDQSLVEQLIQDHAGGGASRYPSLQCQQKCSKECWGGRKWCEDSRAVQQFIVKSQGSVNCSLASYYWYRPSSTAKNIAESLLLKASALALSVELNRVLYLDEQLRWPGTNCTGDFGMDCLLARASVCKPKRGEAQVMPWWHGRGKHETLEAYPVVLLGDQHSKNWSNFEVRLAHKHGFTWLQLQMIQYLLKPTDSMKRLKDRTKHQLALPTQLISLHLRGGDSSRSVQQLPFSRYMEIVQNISARTHIKSVFLATDDLDFRKEATKYSDYKFFFQTLNNKCVSKLSSKRESFECSKMAMIDLYITAECQYVIGDLLSPWGKLVYALQRAQWNGISKYYDVHARDESALV